MLINFDCNIFLWKVHFQQFQKSLVFQKAGSVFQYQCFDSARRFVCFYKYTRSTSQKPHFFLSPFFRRSFSANHF